MWVCEGLRERKQALHSVAFMREVQTGLELWGGGVGASP